MNRVVFGSANHWTSPYQVGSHAWARLFVRHGWKAAYLSDPWTPWHWFAAGSRDRLRERYEIWRKGGVEEDGLRAWAPAALIAPQAVAGLDGRWLMRAWDRLTFPSLDRKVRGWGFENPELLWLDSVRHGVWGRRLRPKRTVLRLADWNAGFGSVPASVLEEERRWLAEADLVITSAQALEARVRGARGGRPLITLRNGVEVDFWRQPAPFPAEYASIPAPRAVYVGALDHWFDADLLAGLAEALPKVSFVLVGHRPSAFMRKPASRNVYRLGARPRDAVRSLLRHAQAGIIPFRRSELIECVCPLKLYEYAACGLRIVATRWEELERMNSPAILAAGLDEWVAGMESVLNNSSAPSEEGLAYATANDWESRWREWETACAGISQPR